MRASLMADLAASGLRPQDLNTREVDSTVLAAVNVSAGNEGYVIPYYNMHGNPIPFYRVKLLNHEPKYKQPKNTQNHVYYPPKFMKAMKAQKLLSKSTGANGAIHTKSMDYPKGYILLTEGEKKAAAACNIGLPTVALGGVYSWRDRTVILPEETQLASPYENNKIIKAKLPPNASGHLIDSVTLARGLSELVDLVVTRNLAIIIVFDTDEETGEVKQEVQKAAATLGYELRHQGVPINCIKQAILPGKGKKTGLDDFIVSEGEEALRKLITSTLEARTAFPRHPNARAYVNGQLEKGKLSRKQAQNLAMAVLTELDGRGRRLESRSTTVPYYFDEVSSRLIPVPLMHRHQEPLHETGFGRFIYKEFGLSSSDSKVIGWLAAQFTGEAPVEEVEPKYMIARPKSRPDCIAYQISDAQFALISPDEDKPIEIMSNGSLGLLFEQDQTEPLDGEEVLSAFAQAHQDAEESGKIEPWWREVLDMAHVMDKDVSSTKLKDVATCLFYCSPWLNRWKGTQLPVELTIGEADSGKSSMYSLRLQILTGRANLRNAPKDVKDWYASVAATGGIHVTDNVHFTKNDLRQVLSDEMCRIITAPQPHIEMRRLYTTSSQVQIPVQTCFALTAIQQPFHNADIMQRAFVLELMAIDGKHDGDYVEKLLQKHGGRHGWIGHHLLILHKFLNKAVSQKVWDTDFKAVHRLAHYEQCLTIMASIIGIDPGGIAQVLDTTTKTNMSEADWALEGLTDFVVDWNKKHKGLKVPRFHASDISDWATAHTDYESNSQLTNARRLGRYMTSHRATIERTTRIMEAGSYANKRQYEIMPA